VKSGWFPSTIKIKGKIVEIPLVSAIIPAGVVPRSYTGRAKDFLKWLGLPSNYLRMFYSKWIDRKYISPLITYFCNFSVVITAEVKHLIRRFIRNKWYKYEAHTQRLKTFVCPPGHRVKQSYSTERLDLQARSIWRAFKRKGRHFSFLSISDEELFSTAFYCSRF